MTTIAWKDGVLACDKCITEDNFVYRGTKFKETDSKVYVGAGYLSRALRFIDYLINEEDGKPPKLKDTIVLEFDKQTGKLTLWENKHIGLPVETKMYAHGSGYGFAIGAMSFGATPEEAIKVATKHDAYTGNGVKCWVSENTKKRLSKLEYTI
jgi:20S proteasome alpha/beta subunit